MEVTRRDLKKFFQDSSWRQKIKLWRWAILRNGASHNLPSEKLFLGSGLS